jgi:4-amino-4-deoxy-L-arabinose transferase-like glycosyltransferase
VFVLLPQRTFHGFDTDWYAALLQAGAFERAATHVAYLPVCQLAWWVVMPFGGGAVHAMLFASALGSAVGVFCVHRAARHLVDGATAKWAAVGVASTPACFYFATAAEVHGVFAAGSGAAWWAFARWRSAPSPGKALVVGAVAGAAATLHAFGHVLVPMFAAIALVQRQLPLRALVVAAGTMAVVHAAVALGIAWSLGHGFGGQTVAATTMLGNWWHDLGLMAIGEVLWRECVFPFLPWSLLAVAGLWAANARPWSLAYLVAFVLHAPIACVFLAIGGENFHERGGYLLPTAVPAVLASFAIVRGKRRWLALTIAAAVAASLVVPRWPARYRTDFVAAVQELAAERPVAFLVDAAELEGLRTHCPGVVCAEVVRSLEAYRGLLHTSGQAADLPQWFDTMLPVLGADRAWIVTADAQRVLAGAPDPAAQALWRDHIRRHYDLEPVARTGLEGAFLLRRR